MLDPLPKLILELRDDDAVDAICHGRVRGTDPAPDVIADDGVTVLSQGDVRSGTTTDPYVAFVVLVRLASPRMTRAPIQETRLGVRCYGRTRLEAFQLYAACSDAIHHIGPRVHSGNNLGIYFSHDEDGASQDTDPDTSQPYESFVITLAATTQAVA